MEKLLDLLDLDVEELQQELTSRLGVAAYRARQVVPWVYRRRVKSFNEMTDIAKEVRTQLSAHYRIDYPELSTSQISNDGTIKYLFKLEDGAEVESVLIKQSDRLTLCVSSQVGCAIGCTFCRTALMGLQRNLRTSEILGQVLAVKDDMAKRLGQEPSAEDGTDFFNIVFMGMGEPLHNLNNVIRAVRMLNEGRGLNFSGRKITVSTAGLVPAIEKFGHSGVRANLAVSLNATTNQVRDVIMPINRRYPLEVLISCLRDYPLKSRKRITIEYVMLKGINDSDQDLARLPRLLKGVPSKVNLIPYNTNAGLGYQTPDEATIKRWQEALLDKGLNATIRWSKGIDIDAACGQLKTSFNKTRQGDVALSNH